MRKEAAKEEAVGDKERPVSETPNQGRRRMTIAIVVLALLSPLLVMAVYVEDWSRDLTTNRATTDPGAADQRLHPVAGFADVEAVETSLARFLGKNAAWSSGEASDLPADSPLREQLPGEATRVWNLVRTTGIMRYRDDVWLVAQPMEDGSLTLHAESRSRVGKGDLGQNPRNLRALMQALQERP